MQVMVFIGSDSDLDIVQDGLDILREFGVTHSLEVTSAHRSPERTIKLVRQAEEDGADIFIAIAGKAAHLAGVLAAHTILPVIGIPVSSSPLQGIDALLSTAQMPAGVPVATMALDRAGARNAAILAAQIIALSDPDVRARLEAHREAMARAVLEDAANQE